MIPHKRFSSHLTGCYFDGNIFSLHWMQMGVNVGSKHAFTLKCQIFHLVHRIEHLDSKKVKKRKSFRFFVFVLVLVCLLLVLEIRRCFCEEVGFNFNLIGFIFNFFLFIFYFDYELALEMMNQMSVIILLKCTKVQVTANSAKAIV